MLEEIEPGAPSRSSTTSSRGWSARASSPWRCPGYWLDIGTPERYLEATWDILEGRVRTRYRARPSEGLLLDPSAEVDPAASIGPRAVVSAGCRIAAGAEVRGSVLLRDCEVGRRRGRLDSILSPGARVGPGARLEGAVIGEDERVSG